jgi:Carboxypeptidase regulatory-like domain
MNWKRFAAFAFALLAVVLFTYQPAWSQANVQAGSIQGTVTDPQGGVVPNAKVTITNKDTGAVINTTTTSAGAFSSGSLSPAIYTVRVEAPSFKTTEVAVNVLINVITPANIKLELGAASTVVEVTGQAVAVNTEQAQVSGSLTTQQIENLPVNGRNFLDLAQLEPGVQIQDGGNFDPTKIGFSSISFGGRFGRSARIAVDGVDVSDENVGTTTTAIPAGAIQEFQLAQSSLDLSNDLTSSGAVNVATKSGTNAIHGEGFGLFRDQSEAAAYPGGALFQRSQYGGNVGGAIIKDKLFYFADGEKLLAHDAGGVLVSNIAGPVGNLDNFTGTFPAPFHDGSALGKLDWQATKSIHAFARFSFWQASDVGNFGGAANYSVYDNRDRTKNVAGGVDFNTGSFTHSFRAEYLKFVNVISNAVVGNDLPLGFPDVTPEINLFGTGYESGPSFLAPQSTIQSDRQVKYDGSKVWGSHIIRYGVGYNRITGWTFANFFGIAPQMESVFDTAVASTGVGGLTCAGGQTGGGCPFNYLPDLVIVGNGQGSFTELQRFGKPGGGLGPDDRFDAYIGDSWKVKPNLTLSYGVRYVRDTGRTDSDLNTTEAINNFFPGFGDPVRQPNKNIAPQAGFAWDPMNNGKTVIRGGIGLYYDNIVFNDVLFDRLLRLTQGAFNVVQTPCGFGPSSVTLGDGTTTYIGGTKAAAGNICPAPNASFSASTGTPIGGVLPAGAGTCAGEVFATCAADFQTMVQGTYSAGAANANFVPTALAHGNEVLTGLLDPNYKSPRAVQMNIGFQRELKPGMVLTVDYLRNVGLHYLLGQDINHAGDISTFNLAAATGAVAATLAACGQPDTSAGITAMAQAGGCLPLHPLAGGGNGSGSISDFAKNGLDSPYDLGIGSCLVGIGAPCAFPGNNPNAGNFYMYRSGGRSVYNGMDIKWVDNIKHPFTGVKYLNFQFTYTLSKFVNAGSTTSGVNAAGGDQDFVNNAIENRNPLALTGPGSLDRTHQFNMGGYADLPLGFRLGIISHFWSPLAITPTVLPVAGSPQSGATAAIFSNDFIGSGQIGNPLPKAETDPTCGTDGGNCSYSLYKVGAYGRQLGPGGLTNAVNNYNANIGGILPTPAGQTLINSGLFTLAQLQALGGVAGTVPAVIPGQVPLAWLKDFDTEVSWVGHLWHERLTLIPSVSIFNTFNLANFDSPANTLTGELNGSAGSINGTVYAGRPDRIGAGTGVFAFGAPRTIEWGLKFQF